MYSKDVAFQINQQQTKEKRRKLVGIHFHIFALIAYAMSLQRALKIVSGINQWANNRHDIDQSERALDSSCAIMEMGIRWKCTSKSSCNYSNVEKKGASRFYTYLTRCIFNLGLVSSKEQNWKIKKIFSLYFRHKMSFSIILPSSMILGVRSHE